MATYAAKLRQETGDSIAEIDTGGSITIKSNLSSTVDALVSQSKAGTVVVAAAALVIPTTHAIVTKSTGGAETLTLANGYIGQVLTITTTAAVGTGTLTPATATGWVSAALIAAGDTITVKFIDATIGWIVVGAAGVLAPPVIALS